MVSAMQIGFDMPPTRSQIDNWENACKKYNTTLAAWKRTVSEDLGAYKIPPTRLAAKMCGAGIPTTPTGPENKRRGESGR
jgi:hypothetical protein